MMDQTGKRWHWSDHNASNGGEPVWKKKNGEA
jgi:hypothetical protein